MFATNKVILVCSAGTTFGQLACEQLFTLKDKFTIRAADKSQERLDQLKRKMGKHTSDGTFETVVFDLGRPDSIEAGLKNVRRVVLYLPNDPQREQYGRNFIDAVRKMSQPLEQLVLISVIGSQQREVAMQKEFWNIEKYARDGGLPVTVINTAPYQETITHFYCDQIARGELRLPVKEDGRFGLVSIRELATACAGVMEQVSEHIGQNYSLTGPEIFTGKDVARIISETINKDIRFHPESIDNAVDHLTRSAGWPREDARPIVEFLHWMSSKGDMKNPSKDAQKLGVRSVPFKEIVMQDREYLMSGKNRTDPL